MADNDKNKAIVERNLIASTCPQCGGFLALKHGGDIKCEYCGSSFMLNQAYSDSDDRVKNFYELAYTAQQGQNEDEAYHYFTKVLEVKSNEPMAWFGKGVTTLGRSTALSIYADEALASFHKASEYATKQSRDSLSKEIYRVCIQYAGDFYNVLKKREWLDSSNFNSIMKLYLSSDKYRPLTIEMKKFLADAMFRHLHLVDYREKMNNLVQEIKKLEPKYRSPEQVFSRQVLFKFLGFVIAIVAGIGLIVLIAIQSS